VVTFNTHDALKTLNILGNEIIFLKEFLFEDMKYPRGVYPLLILC